jgi:hypothetical protein
MVPLLTYDGVSDELTRRIVHGAASTAPRVQESFVDPAYLSSAAD